MPTVDIIDCRIKGSTVAFLFAPSMASNSTIVGNINVFENLNIHQLELLKEDPQFNDLIIIWWGNLKTDV